MLDASYQLAISCALLVIVLNLNTLSNGFALDDVVAIIENEDVKPDTPLENVFRNDFWGVPMHHHRSHKCYRPFVVLSFRLNYYLDGLNSFGFHLINIALGSLVCSQVVFLCDELFGRERLLATAVAGLLFASHPIHTEAVSRPQPPDPRATAHYLPVTATNNRSPPLSAGQSSWRRH